MLPPRYAPHRDVPAYRHRPGATPHPRTDPRGHSHGLPEPSSPPLTPANSAGHEAWRFGVDLFDLGYWWEAHEQWEAAWRATTHAATRHLLQGLIQVGAALLKWEAGNGRGRRGLWRRARAHLAAVPDHEGAGLGVEVADLRRRLEEIFADADEDDAAIGRPPAVVIHFRPG